MRYANRLHSVIAVAALVTALAGCAGPSSNPAAETALPTVPAPALPDSLVSVQWLSEHLEDPDLVVLDCSVTITMGEDGSMSVESGRAAYDEGHIPTAGFADLTGELADGNSPIAYALPAPVDFAAVMGALGVGDDTRVVLYDSSFSAWAARVWWMLRWVGFDRAAILDGGLGAWSAEDLPLSTEPASEPVRVLTPAPRPGLIANRDEVFAAIDDPSVTLIDAMPEAHYRGEMTMYARPGHIPTAVNVPATALLDEAGHYKSLDELGQIVAVDDGGRAITYCGGGIAASSAAFAMTRLGYDDVAVYTASLQEWAADPDNPMEVEQ